MMIKARFRLIAMACVAVLAFGACSDDTKNEGITVPDAISKALNHKYPSVSEVEWEQKGAYYVADCLVDGKEKDVWFNVEAVWQLTETNLSWNNLPGTVQTAFNGSEYAGWKLEDVDMLEYPLQPIQYVIEVENGNTEYQLFYAEDGDLLQERNVTGKDDTHWPITK